MVLNEVLIDAAAADDGKTFVEIAGPGGADVGGFKITDVEGLGATAGSLNTDGDFGAGETDGVVVLPAGTRIPVDGILVVADATAAGTTAVPGVTAADVLVRDIDFENSGGDAVQLVSASGALLDALGTSPTGAALATNTAVNGLAMYETATAFYPTTNATIARSATSLDTDHNGNDFHVDPSPTPGAPNDTVNLTITSLTPDDGLATVATPITVVGTDFATGTTLTIGGNTPAICTVASATQMTCTAPTNAGVVAKLDVTATYPTAVGGRVRSAKRFHLHRRAERDERRRRGGLLRPSVPSELLGADGDADARHLRPHLRGRRDAAGRRFGERDRRARVWPDATNPTTQAGWLYFPTTFNVQVGNDDEYQASFTAPAVAATTTYGYVYRMSLDGGLNYTYCDSDGAGANATFDFSSASLGVMTVTP